MNKSSPPDSSAPFERLEAAFAALRRAALTARERLGTGLQLTRTQLDILFLLAEQPSQTTGQLARQLFLTSSAVTQTVDTLVRRQLLERQPHPGDRRLIQLHLRAEGRRLIQELQALRRQRLHELVAQLSPTETELLITATHKITVFLDSTPGSPSSTHTGL